MFYTQEQLQSFGFKKLGENVLISDKCSIYGANRISIGSNVRIDDFCILSAGSEIIIGDYIHIACYASLIGKGLIQLENFCSVAARSTILSSCDDFSGKHLVNPTVPEKYLSVQHKPVIFKKHAVVGVGTVVLPGVTLGEGSAVGANSLVKDDVPPYEIWIGTPLKFLKRRHENLKELERLLYEEFR